MLKEQPYYVFESIVPVVGNFNLNFTLFCAYIILIFEILAKNRKKDRFVTIKGGNDT